METITLTKIGQEKTINYTNKKTGQPASFNKVGIQCSEYGERWMDFTYRGQHSLAIGQKLTGDIVPRDYNGKTYYDFKLPKKDAAPQSDARAINIIQFEVVPKLDKIISCLEMMSEEIVSIAKRLPEVDEFPLMDETNDAHGI